MLFLLDDTVRILWLNSALFAGDMSSQVLCCFIQQFEKQTQIQSLTCKGKKIAFKRWVWLPSFKNHSDIRWWWFSRNPGAQGCFTAAALLIQPTSDYVPWSLLTCLCLEPGQRNSRACWCLLAKRMQSSALIYFHHLWFKYFRNTQVFKTAKWIITTVYCMG